MSIRRLCLPLALPALLLAGCDRTPDAPDNNAAWDDDPMMGNLAFPTEETGEALDEGEAEDRLVPPAPGEVGGLPDDREPLDERAARDPTSVAASGATIELWGSALGEGRYGDAYRLWQDGGKASGLSEAQFANSYRKYREIHVLVGRPVAQGARNVQVPVQVYGRERADGEPFNLLGTMTLVRNAGPRPWLISASDLQPRGTVRIVPSDGNRPAALIPAAFRGNWSSSAASCGKAGDDMRLAVAADSLTFYESVGQVRRVRSLGANRIELTADYNGEGDRWTDKATLALSADGRALTIGEVKRVRCT